MSNDARNYKKDLDRIEKRIRNKIVKSAMKVALKPLAADIRQNAPVDTGDLRGHIKIKPGNRKKDKLVMIIEISTADNNPHAARVEYGTKEKPAEPFIRPAIARDVDKVVKDFRDSLDAQLGA